MPFLKLKRCSWQKWWIFKDFFVENQFSEKIGNFLRKSWWIFVKLVFGVAKVGTIQVGYFERYFLNQMITQEYYFIRLECRLQMCLLLSIMTDKLPNKTLASKFKTHRAYLRLATVIQGFQQKILLKKMFHLLVAVWPVKSRQMSIKVAKNDFTKTIQDFDTLTKIA